MNKPNFSWIQTHHEIVDFLKDKEESQLELIEILKSIGISPFNDKSKDGPHDIELSEIDPFTFFCYLYKYGSERRLGYLQALAKKLNINIPDDDSGLPSAQAQKVWMFPYKYLRVNSEIKRLWSFFNKALKDEITNNDFEDILRISSTGKTKITEVLYYLNPNKYLPINGPIKTYLKDKYGLDYNFETYSDYINLLKKIHATTNDTFFELSYEAWMWSRKKNSKSYWIFQGNPKNYNIIKGLEENLVNSWSVNAHKNNIKIGDKVIIWITGNNSGCYALAEVIDKPDKRGIETDSHLWKTENTSEDRVNIKIIHSFVKNPILKSDILNLPEFNNFKGGNQGTNFTATKEQYDIILSLANINDSSQTTTTLSLYPKNLILYGPPGTGKTYNTKRKAVQIIENLPDEQIKLKDDNYIKSFYDKYKSAGQIEFVTFHQSYYYEQFVEGISVITSIEDNKNVIYKVKSGILKEIYERIKNYEKLVEKDNFNNGSTLDFNKLYTAFISKLSKILTDLDENENHYFESRRKKVKLVSIVDDKIETIGENANSNEVITKDHLKRIYNKFNSPEDIKNINKDIREVGTDLGWTTNYYAVFKALKDFESSIVINNKTTQSDNKKNYVLIIDEINRGNISKIFGELITLIEDDKRLGAENEIIVTLPFSGEQFGVPPNLYIIGTMNTADRSLVQLDTALRRRFDFEEMMPKYREDFPQEEVWKKFNEKINNTDIDLSLFLRKLNEKICKEYDREHQIGHSYLMKVSYLADLQRAWENKIMPLLQEYFYSNFDCLAKVIGIKSKYLNQEKDAWQLNMKTDNFVVEFWLIYNFVCDIKNTQNELQDGISGVN